MLVQFGNYWMKKIPLTANYFQIGQHVVLLHIPITGESYDSVWCNQE